MEEKTPWYKNKRIWLIVGAVFIGLIVGNYSGRNAASIELEGEKVKYDKLAETIGNKENELKELEDEVTRLSGENETLQKEIDANENILNDIEEYKANKEEVEQLEAKISDLKSQISEKEDELASLIGKIKETGEAPIELSAGTFVVGQDIPEGRYKVLPIGRGSNFFVYDSSGGTVVNTIISSRDGHGVPEYITYLFDGYIIEANSPFKYVPVE